MDDERKKAIIGLLSDAQTQLYCADRITNVDKNKYTLTAIAKSITAIAMMFATDYEKEFGEVDNND